MGADDVPRSDVAHAMAQTASDFFEARVREYDSLARRGLPRRDEMLAELVRTLPDAAVDVLELGCGTGALTLRLAARYSAASLTVVDAAPGMIGLARERLRAAHSAVAEQACFVTSTFEELALPDASFDCVTSSMSLHHVIDKAPLYRRLRSALREGGAFVFADELTGAVPHVQQLHWQRWIEFARLPRHLEEREIAEIIEHMTAWDHYETLPRQLELLAEAEFQEVDCAWRRWNYGIFVAVR